MPASQGITYFTVSNGGFGALTYSSQVTAGQAWLSVTTGESGSAPGQITLYLFTANTGATRVATVTITAAGASASPKTVTVTQEGVPTSDNPAPSEVAAQIRSFAQQYQLPAIIIAAVMSKESPGWKQFDESGNPLVGSTGDVGIMQLNITNPPFTFDHERVKTDWVYNLKIGCGILKYKFGKYAFDTSSPYDSVFDTRPDLIENWYYPVAWYNGEGEAAYAYVKSVWQYIGNLPAPGNAFFANVSSVGNPQSLSGFPTTIYPIVPYPEQDNDWFLTATPQQLLSGGFYTLLFEAQASQRIHRWDWNSSSAVDVTDEILGQTPSGVTLSLSPGWNTVSFPVIPRGLGGTNRFSDVFSDVASNVLFPYVFYLNTEGFLEYKAFSEATCLAGKQRPAISFTRTTVSRNV